MGKQVNQTNAIVNELYKEYLDCKANKEGEAYHKKMQQIGESLALTMRITGAISIMSKNTLIKLIAMQSTIRFMQPHSFYICFSIACDELELK